MLSMHSPGTARGGGVWLCIGPNLKSLHLFKVESPYEKVLDICSAPEREPDVLH